MVLLYLIHTLDHPKWSSGGQDMHVSPNGGTAVVRVTFLSPTLLHKDCHSSSELSQDIPTIETRVWRTCSQFLCISDWLKQTSGDQDSKFDQVEVL